MTSRVIYLLEHDKLLPFYSPLFAAAAESWTPLQKEQRASQGNEREIQRLYYSILWVKHLHLITSILTRKMAETK